jgi:hypothetical protein
MSGEGESQEPPVEAEAAEPPVRARPLLGTLYVFGGLAMLLLGYVFGYGSILAGSLAMALMVVGVTGVGAGGYILWRALRGE